MNITNNNAGGYQNAVKLKARGYKKFWGDPHMPYLDLLINTQALDKAWGVTVTVEGRKLELVLDETLSNNSQHECLLALKEWLSELDACQPKIVITQDDKYAMPIPKLAGEIYEWVFNDIGHQVVPALQDGSMKATHSYITVGNKNSIRKAVVTAHTLDGKLEHLSASDTLQFLTHNPDCVIYPSKACIGLENIELYRDNAEFKKTHLADTKYSPLKHLNWLSLLSTQLRGNGLCLWDELGTDSYAGFAEPILGCEIPNFLSA